MKKIKVSIEGKTPLLINRFRDTQIESKSKKRSGAFVEQNIEDKLYLYDGKPHVPSIYLRNSLVEAGKQFQIGGKKKATYSKLLGSTIGVEPDNILLNGNWEIFRVAAVNPMTRGRMMVSRPRFNKWKCEFDIIFNDEEIPTEVMNELLVHAGNYVGIGDWRPEKKGMFGKFMVTSFKEV